MKNEYDDAIGTICQVRTVGGKVFDAICTEWRLDGGNLLLTFVPYRAHGTEWDRAYRWYDGRELNKSTAG